MAKQIKLKSRSNKVEAMEEPSLATSNIKTMDAISLDPSQEAHWAKNNPKSKGNKVIQHTWVLKDISNRFDPKLDLLSKQTNKKKMAVNTQIKSYLTMRSNPLFTSSSSQSKQMVGLTAVDEGCLVPPA